MPNAIAITAHHDDAVLWCGGTIMRTRRMAGWNWTVVALCVPDPDRQVYFDSYCAAAGVTGRRFNFVDYLPPPLFSHNRQADFEAAICESQQSIEFDFVFTHSKDVGGEYGGHANHDEVRIAAENVFGSSNLIHFCYSNRCLKSSCKIIT